MVNGSPLVDHKWHPRFGMLAKRGCSSCLQSSALARIDEYFCQRLAPTLESSPAGELTTVHGIGIRLIRDSCVDNIEVGP